VRVVTRRLFERQSEGEKGQARSESGEMQSLPSPGLLDGKRGPPAAQSPFRALDPASRCPWWSTDPGTRRVGLHASPTRAPESGSALGIDAWREDSWRGGER